MAILDWPTTEGFQPMRPVLVGASSPKSSFIGAYTGERTESSRLADRMVMEMVLPTTTAAIGRKRAAWIKSLASTGNLVRMPVWPQRYRQGTMSGSPTVSATVDAGVRSVSLSGVLSAPNLISGSGFEIDSNADGLADGWTQYTSGSVGTVTTVMPSAAANTGTTGLCQRVSSTALNGAIGLRRTSDMAVTVGLSYSWSVTQAATAGTTISVEIAWYNGGSYLSSSTASAVAANGRRSITGTAPATATVAKLYVYATSASSGAVAINVDDAQFEQSAAATAYAGPATALAGDVVGIGGNLLEVGPTNCTANDAGALTLGLALPTLRSITSGAVVTTTNATGVWQLDEVNAPLFGYEAGPMQGPVSLSFRQVAQ